MMVDHSTHEHNRGTCTLRKKRTNMFFRYTDSVALPKELTLETAEAVADKIREMGEVRDRPQFLRRVDFVVEAGSEWELRDLLSDLQVELASMGVEFDPDRANVSQVPGS